MPCNTISYGFQAVLRIANYVLTGIFTLEMVFKLIGLGFRGYCADSFNIFDGVIVIVSLIELVGEIVGFEADSAMSALRTFRLFRVFKLARSWQSLNQVSFMAETRMNAHTSWTSFNVT